jgi:hypothetical protein
MTRKLDRHCPHPHRPTEMGCDYYRIVSAIYVLSTGEKEYVQLEKAGMYLFGGEFDSDFLSLSDWLDEKDKKHAPIYIMKDGNWLCRPDAQSHYTALAKENQIDLANVREIYKTTWYEQRY